MNSRSQKVKLGYDVIIVGAGAAGCFLASELKPNLGVLLLDYRVMPRKKACSGIIVKEAHDILIGKNPPDDIFFEPKQLDMVYWDWDNNLKKESKKAFWNSSRRKLDEWLYKTAITKENVSFLEKARFVDFFTSKNDDFVVVVLECDGEIRSVVTKYLIGCDGALSSIRSKISLSKVPYYVAIQENLPNNPLKEAYFIFDNSLTDFYGWVIPKGGLVEVGIAVLPQNSREKFEKFKEKVKEKFGISGKGELDSAIVLRPTSLTEVVLGSGNVLLCGEAACLISPSSAEGISYAIRSAKYCADALNTSFKDALPEYKKNCKPLLERLLRKFEKSDMIKDKSKRKKLFA